MKTRRFKSLFFEQLLCRDLRAIQPIRITIAACRQPIRLCFVRGRLSEVKHGGVHTEGERNDGLAANLKKCASGRTYVTLFYTLHCRVHGHLELEI